MSIEDFVFLCKRGRTGLLALYYLSLETAGISTQPFIIVPDSSEWFAWLASLTSFRFAGKCGRFHARREYDQGPKRSWTARRVFRRRQYKHYLGTTDHLTIACLEQMAARLQAEGETDE